MKIVVEFDRLDLWRTNVTALGQPSFRCNHEIQTRILFFLLTFPFFAKEHKQKSNVIAFGHLTFVSVPKYSLEILFFLLTFSFLQKKK